MSRRGERGPSGPTNGVVRRPVGSRDEPIEATLDAAVVSSCPPYLTQVVAAKDALLKDAQAEFESRTAALLAEDPSRHDVLTPAPWRTTLRVLGFLAAATALAGVFVAWGLRPRHQPAIDASTVAIVVGTASLLAVGTLGASLLFPSRMGIPNQTVARSLWIAAAGALGSLAGLATRRDTWDPSTPVWWTIVAIAGTASLTLAVLVAIARRRAHDSALITDSGVNRLRLEALDVALERATHTVTTSWQHLDTDTRAVLEAERDATIAVLLEERYSARIDPRWLRGAPPGVVGLPFVTDKAHETMHLGAAQIAARDAAGAYGHFVERYRRESTATDARQRNGDQGETTVASP